MRLPHFILPEDYVIVCGDFGLLWAKNRTFEYNLKWLSGLPFTILLLQGYVITHCMSGDSQVLEEHLSSGISFVTVVWLISEVFICYLRYLSSKREMCQPS